MAHRMPLNHTNRRNGVLAGACLMEYAYVGCAPRVRLIPTHTVLSGTPSWHRVTRLRLNSYAMGPFVPSETVRRYHPADGRLAAKVASVRGVCVSGTPTRVARPAPLYVSVGSVGEGRWSQHRVSAGTDTNDVTPRQASTASRKSGLFP